MKTRSWSRRKQPTRVATVTAESSQHEQTKKLPSTSPSTPSQQSTFNRRRRLKSSKNATNKANKLMEESKYYPSKRLITELDITPTTYRPVPPKIQPKIVEKNIFKPPLIGTDGYRFENPFENPTNFNNIKMTTQSVTPKPMSVHYTHEKENVYRMPLLKPKDTIKYGESRDSKKIHLGTSPGPNRKPHTLYETKLKIFPYELVQSKKSRFEKNSQEKRVKLNFPYEIVNASPLTANKLQQKSFSSISVKPESWQIPTVYAQNALTRTSSKSSVEKRRKKPVKLVEAVKPIKVIPKVINLAHANEKKPHTSAEFDFGQPDSSPWIPITPKDIYEIHGYDSPGYVPSQIKVKEQYDDDSARVPEKDFKFSPVRVYDSPKTISTSYTVHHVYPTAKQNPAGRYRSNPFVHNRIPHHDLHDAAESMHKPNTFGSAGSDTTEFSLPAQLNSYLQTPTASTTSAATSDITTASTQHGTKTRYPDDIITAHSSNIRDAFSSKQRDKMLAAQPPHRSTSEQQITTTTNLIMPSRSDSVDETKDIETLSSNQYAIFQRVNYTLPMDSTTASLKDLNDEFNQLFLNERDKFLFRHPHLPRETSKFIKMRPEETPHKNVTSKRDIVFSSVKNGSITQLTKVSKRNDVYQKPMLVYPQDYSSSAKYVERLTLAHYSVPENVVYNPLPLDYHSRVATLTNHLRNDTRRIKRELPDENDNEKEPVNVFLGGTTTEIVVNVKKYPFYKTVPPDGISKYSVLRYVSNPSEIPKKRNSHMAFYESRDKIQCSEPQPPSNVIPNRENGEWSYDRQLKGPRVTLGDKIACLKIKFFGSDPLDNPFFKEESIGFPEIFDKEERVAPLNEREEENIYDVESQQDYEVLPKRFLKSIRHKKVSENNKRTTLFKRETAAAANGERRYLAKSPVRLWIESLAESPYPEFQKLYKRSAKEKFESDAAEKEEKQVKKVLYVGGFLNRKDLVDKRKNKNKKFQKKEITTLPDISASDVTTSSNELAYGDGDASQSTLRYDTVHPTTMNSAEVESTTSSSAEEESSIENWQEEDTTEGVTQPADKVQDLKFFQKLPTIGITKTSTAPTESSTVARRDLVYFHNTRGSGSDAVQLKTKTNEGRKKVFVDALSSLRSQQNSSNNEPSRLDDNKYKYNYKEPTWRIKTPSSPNTTAASGVFAHEVDSLLYVIHPKTGEGKWMKLLKVEEIDDTATKADSLSIGNDASSNTVRPPSHYSDDGEDGHQLPCREEEETDNEIGKDHHSEYDVSKLIKYFFNICYY